MNEKVKQTAAKAKGFLSGAVAWFKGWVTNGMVWIFLNAYVFVCCWILADTAHGNAVQMFMTTVIFVLAVVGLIVIMPNNIEWNGKIFEENSEVKS